LNKHCTIITLYLELLFGQIQWAYNLLADALFATYDDALWHIYILWLDTYSGMTTEQFSQPLTDERLSFYRFARSW